jgi:outer membrane protein TolC
MVVGQFAVAALSERRNRLRIQGRRSETAATRIKLTHYREAPSVDLKGGVCYGSRTVNGWYNYAERASGF